MLKLENISIELKKINKEAQLLSIKELIDKIDQDVKESNVINKPSDKKQFTAIKKYLNNRKLKDRPLLQCITPLKDNRIAFTNSYSLFILDKKYIPVKVAFDNSYTEEEKKDYLQKNNIDKKDVESGSYPILKNVIPNECDQIDTLNLNVNNFLSWYKVQDKKNKDLVYNIGDDLLEFNVNPSYLKDIIDILKLENDIIFEYYGEYKPAITRTSGGREIGLILPIKII